VFSAARPTQRRARLALRSLLVDLDRRAAAGDQDAAVGRAPAPAEERVADATGARARAGEVTC
jgi:type IV secretory pathway TrbL component